MFSFYTLREGGRFLRRRELFHASHPQTPRCLAIFATCSRPEARQRAAARVPSPLRPRGAGAWWLDRESCKTRYYDGLRRALAARTPVRTDRARAAQEQPVGSAPVPAARGPGLSRPPRFPKRRSAFRARRVLVPVLASPTTPRTRTAGPSAPPRRVRPGA